MGLRDRSFGEAIAEVAPRLEAEGQRAGDPPEDGRAAVATIAGCDTPASRSSTRGVRTPAASDDVPRRVDRLQYAVGEGPCLDAIWKHDVFQTGDLRSEDR
jgi:hypothetical protein